MATSGPTKSRAELHEERVAGWLAERRARAAMPDAPREGWIEVRTVNDFGDVVSRQVPARLHSNIVAFPTWRPGASLHASAAFASEHLADAADANPNAAEELVPLAWLVGLASRAALRFERGTLTDEDRAAVRKAANVLRQDMTPRREGVAPNYEGHEPHVGPWQTLPQFTRRDRVGEQLEQAERYLPRDHDRSPPSRPYEIAKDPRAFYRYAVALSGEVGPRTGNVNTDRPKMEALEADLRKLWNRGKLDAEAALIAAYVHLEGMTLEKARDVVRGAER